MTVSCAVPDAGTALLGMPSGHLSLRIRGTERDGQIVRIRSAKCSIGSAPNCTLRLQARGIRPMHCLIVRGPEQTVVRRWSPDTRLNGATFTDAALRPGDRLGIGPLEFDVLADEPAATATHVPAEKSARLESAGPNRSASELTSDLDAMRESTDMSARSAIDRHVRRRWAHAAIGKLIVSALAALTGVFFIGFCDGAKPLAYLGAWLSILVAIFWGLQSATLLRHLAFAPQQPLEKPPESRI